MTMEIRQLSNRNPSSSFSSEIIPRSIPYEQNNMMASTLTQTKSSSSSFPASERSPSRSMRIENILNNDEDEDSIHPRQFPIPRSYGPPSTSSSRAYCGWTTNNMPSPSDGTSSPVDSTDYRDYDAHSETRENRPAYLIEEDTFIWYHRDDRGMKWDEVSAAFNEYFPKDRQRHGLQGIQGRYYRILKDEGVPKLRSRQKKRPRRDYGVVARTSRRYPWMSYA